MKPRTVPNARACRAAFLGVLPARLPAFPFSTALQMSRILAMLRLVLYGISRWLSFLTLLLVSHESNARFTYRSDRSERSEQSERSCRSDRSEGRSDRSEGQSEWSDWPVGSDSLKVNRSDQSEGYFCM